MTTTIHLVDDLGAILTITGHRLDGRPVAVRLELHVREGCAWWVGDDGPGGGGEGVRPS